MNTKTIKKVVAVLLLAKMMISMISVQVSALTPKEIKGTAKNTTAISKAGQNIVGVLQAVGIVLSVVMLSVIGIKYLMGSAEEKADYKKSLMPYVVGAALIFTASIFAQAIYEFFSGWTAG